MAVAEPMEGSCHCGAVRLTVAQAPTEVTECHCSICRRYGALWAYYPSGEATYAGPTEVYAWGRKACAFHRCGTCGCVVGWWPHGADFGHCAVNARVLEGLDLDAVTRNVEEDASM
ncbi:MAG TPA: hypothetical protein VM899_11995 [Rubellimicrobium sp.]|nr:hypothetical protein [Rubellimicrobium sp.]